MDAFNALVSKMNTVDEKPYSKREEDDFRREVRDNLQEIKFQTKKTNGTVADLKLWQARIIAAVSVLTFLTVSIGLPVALVALEIYFKTK